MRNDEHKPANGYNEEREHLLRSLDDLDREFAAGDIDQHDYETLRADYTSRAAAIIRRSSGSAAFEQESDPTNVTARAHQVPPHGATATTETSEVAEATAAAVQSHAQNSATGQTLAAKRTKRSPVRRLAVALGVLAVAVGSGVAVARFAGERVGSTGLTGTVRQAASPQQQAAAKFMQVGRDNLGSDPIKSLQAFDAALKIDPTIAEAMAYSGWVLRIASLSAEGKDAEDLRAGAIRRIDEAIIADPTYPDAYAFKGVIALRDQDDPKTALAAFKKLDGLQTPPFVQQLVGSARKEAEDALAETSPSTGPARTATTKAR
jgi:tetratricopeptide (TPR) repeat protein